MSSGRPRGYPGGRPGAKTSVKPSKSSLIPLSMLFFPKKHGLARKKRSFSAFFALFCAFLARKGSVPVFWNFLPALFSSKLCFFEPPNALVTMKKARV